MMISSQISDEYLLSGAIFLALCVIFLLVRHFISRRVQNDPRRQFAIDALKMAMTQKDVFYLKMPDLDGHNDIKAQLVGMDGRGLEMLAKKELPQNLVSHPVEANFTLASSDGAKFYKFDSKIMKIAGSPQQLHIFLLMPQALQVEKKRHFGRIRPDQDSVKKIALWPLDPGRPLPAASSRLDKAPVLFVQNITPTVARIENLSGSGLGLRLDKEAFAALDSHPQTGDGILCAIDFKSPSIPESTLNFWFTAEIMNIRSENDGARLLGLEFTNWALGEEESDILRWTYSSPYKGARPILDLVRHEEEKQRQASGKH